MKKSMAGNRTSLMGRELAARRLRKSIAATAFHKYCGYEIATALGAS
jgi:hypothetical protein